MISSRHSCDYLCCVCDSCMMSSLVCCGDCVSVSVRACGQNYFGVYICFPVCGVCFIFSHMYHVTQVLHFSPKYLHLTAVDRHWYGTWTWVHKTCKCVYTQTHTGWQYKCVYTQTHTGRPYKCAYTQMRTQVDYKCLYTQTQIQS